MSQRLNQIMLFLGTNLDFKALRKFVAVVL